MKSKSLLLHLVLALSAISIAQAATIVPGGYENTPGNGQSVDPFDNYGTGGSRFQQVYDASLFTGFTNAESITSVAFRPKQPQFGSFIGNSFTVSNIIIQLSTTMANDAMSLSGIFANNIGLDFMTVYSGALTLTASNSSTSPSPFDYLITFQNPFLYDRSQGNLLLDVLIPDDAVISGSGRIGFRALDTITDAFPSADGMGTVRGATGSGPIGANSTLAVISQFTSVTVQPATVPETASVLLVLAPCLAALGFMRQRLVAVRVRA